MTDFIIRQATSDDAPIILELVKDLAEYEKMPNGPRIGAETLANDLKRGAVQVKLAFSGERSAGYTLYYYAYSSWEGQYIHMEDLYIRPEFQRKGLAKRLVKSLAEESLEKGYTRIRWDVLDWNKPARDFYQTIDAINLSGAEGWLTYRLDEPRIKALASE